MKSTEFSGVGNISCSIPQGIFVKRILIFLYANDLSCIKTIGRDILIGDEATIIWHNKDLDDLKTPVEEDFN